MNASPQPAGTAASIICSPPKGGNKGGTKKGPKKGPKKGNKAAAAAFPRGRRLLRTTVSALCCATLGGCVLAGTPKVRSGAVTSDTYVATDARQRLVTTTSIGNFSRPGRTDPTRVMCAEPSPDAASAIASQLSGALSVIGRGSASLTATHAESLIQLAERTASIQLLRDKMYQTCLAYANGAITGTTYTLIMSQLDQTIVTLLLGETAGGAFGRSGAAARTAANGSANSSLVSLPAGLEGLSDAADEVSVAQADLKKKIAALDTATKACDEEKQADAENGPKSDACTGQDKAKTAMSQAEGKLGAMLKILRAELDSSADGAAKGESAEGVGGLQVTPNVAIARQLVQMQDNFLFTDGTASFLPTCLVELATQADNESTAAQSLDVLIAYERSALAAFEVADREASSHTPDTREHKAAIGRRTEAGSELDRTRAQLNSFIQEMRPALASRADGASTPQRELFTALKAGITANGTLADENLNLADVIGAANQAHGQSKLAQICMRYLPAYLTQATQDSKALRASRLEQQYTVALAEAQARATEMRLAINNSFPSLLGTCDGLKGTDEEKKECRSTVFTLVRQQAAPTTSAPAMLPANAVEGNTTIASR